MTPFRWMIVGLLLLDFVAGIWLSVRNGRKQYVRGLWEGWDKAIRMSRAGLKPYLKSEIDADPKARK